MDEDAVAALDDHAAVLSGTDPGGDRDDLAPVAERVAGADVVGLGEGTHGSRALFELKHRLVRLLVADRGFRTVALEADVAATAAVDAYVRRGEGDPAGALADLVVWPWRVEELLSVLEWLRAFNEGRPAGDRVRVVGVSPNDATRPAGRLRASLGEVAPGAPGAVEEALGTVAAGDLPDDRDRLDDLRSAVDALRERLGDDQEARRDCRGVAQALAWHRTRSEYEGPHAAGMAHRDRLMAGNVLRALDRDPGAGVVVWAHDSHVQRGTFDDGTAWTDAATAGETLHAELGERYRVLGSEVGRGSVRAREAGEGGPPRTFDLGAPRTDSVAAHLDAIGESPLFVDLAAAGDDDRLAGWLAHDRAKRRVGSVYDPGADPGHHYLETDLAASFDGLLFAGASGPTRTLDDA